MNQSSLNIEKKDFKEKRRKYQFLKYIVKKAGFYFLTLFTMISLTFFIFYSFIEDLFPLPNIVPPINPSEDYIEKIRRYLAIREFWGVGKPLWQAYFEFILQVFTLDFGPTINLIYY